MKDRALRPVWAEINLDNLIHNIKEVRRVVNKDAEIMAVIKADGYGHGALGIYKELLENGADRLAVAVATEALQLRKDGYQGPLLVLGYTDPSFYQLVIENDLIQTIYTVEQGKLLSQVATDLRKKVKVHIKIDTGMGRIGINSDDRGIEIVKEISQIPNIEIEGIYTHFAAADEKDKEYTELQYNKYHGFIEGLSRVGIEIKYKHLSNSAGIIDLPQFNMDLVRPGIMLYGLYPSEDVDKTKVNLREVMSLKAKVAYVKTIIAGTSVSYGRKFIADKERVIATLPLGYADGLTRLLSQKAEVLIKRKRVPIVGRICMDQCMIDVTEVGDVHIGDEVVIFGSQDGERIAIDEVAQKLGTINYEVVCMISKRIPRVYKKGESIVNIQDSIYDIQ